MSQGTRKTWISVLIASVIIVGLLAAAAIGGTVFFIYRHVNTQFTPSDNAEQQFAEARARFTGQQPLIEIRRDDEPVLKLVRVSIPFWLLRMAPSRHVSFLNDSGIDFDSDRVHLTLEDLERRGPGLILDQADRRGSQVLVWTESVAPSAR